MKISMMLESVVLMVKIIMDIRVNMVEVWFLLWFSRVVIVELFEINVRLNIRLSVVFIKVCIINVVRFFVEVRLIFVCMGIYFDLVSNVFDGCEF